MTLPFPLVQSRNIQVNLGQSPILCNKFSIQLGNYGSISQASVGTSIQALRQWVQAAPVGPLNNNPFTLAQNGLPIPLDIFGDGVHLFGGAIDLEDFKFHTDGYTVAGRDAAAPLVDSKRVLSDVQYLNVSPTSLVQQIAKLYGLSTRITPYTVTGATSTVGTIFKNEAALTTVPQQPWRLLQALARAIKYRCYVTPEAVLVFEPIGQQLGINWSFEWMQSPNSTNDSAYPIAELTLRYQPRRHHSFIVLVKSHNHQAGQLTSGSAVYLNQGFGSNSGGSFAIGQPIAPGLAAAASKLFGFNVNTLNAGLFTGSSGSITSGILKSAGAKIPTYLYNMEGRTADQCQQIADAIANDIASHLFIWTLKVNGLPGIAPFDTIEILDPQNQLFGANQGLLSVSAVSHDFGLINGHGLSDGFTTTLTALNIPATSSDNLLGAIGGS